MRLVAGFFLCIFLTANSFAMEITGQAPEFKASFIRLYVVEDFVTYREVKADVARIADDGSFSLHSRQNTDVMVKIRIDHSVVSLVVPKDARLQLELRDDAEFNKGRIFDRQLMATVVNRGDNGINELIQEFQKEHASFLQKNYEKFVTKTILPEIEKFREAMLTRFEEEQSGYFKTYLLSELAALEDAALGSEKKVYDEAIRFQPVKYHNLGYMDLFIQFYQERFVQLSQGKDGFQVLSYINGTQDYGKLEEVVLKQPFIPHDTLAELFIVFGLREIYTDQTFKKQKVLDMLKYIAANGKYYENKKLAQTIVDEFNFMARGTKAPDFSLKNTQGEVVHLTDYSGSPVLLFFWASTSRMSLMQLEWVKDYAEKYKSDLVILGVNMDDEREVADAYLQRNPVSWTVLFKDRQFDVSDKYRIASLPLFVTIDKKGNIVKYPASLPEENLEMEINRLLSE